MKHFFTRLLDAQEVVGETNSAGSMLDMMDLLILVMFIGFGFYCIYTFFRLKRECMLFDSKVLYPGNCPAQDCTDPVGFMEYIQYRILILGIFLVFCGGLDALNTYVLKFTDLWFSIVQIVLPLAGLAWYAIIQRKAAKLFW